MRMCDLRVQSTILKKFVSRALYAVPRVRVQSEV